MLTLDSGKCGPGVKNGGAPRPPQQPTAEGGDAVEPWFASTEIRAREEFWRELGP